MRIMLFLLTNIAVIAVISITFRLLGIAKDLPVAPFQDPGLQRLISHRGVVPKSPRPVSPPATVIASLA